MHLYVFRLSKRDIFVLSGSQPKSNPFNTVREGGLPKFMKGQGGTEFLTGKVVSLFVGGFSMMKAGARRWSQAYDEGARCELHSALVLSYPAPAPALYGALDGEFMRALLVWIF